MLPKYFEFWNYSKENKLWISFALALVSSNLLPDRFSFRPPYPSRYLWVASHSNWIWNIKISSQLHSPLYLFHSFGTHWRSADGERERPTKSVGLKLMEAETNFFRPRIKLYHVPCSKEWNGSSLLMGTNQDIQIPKDSPVLLTICALGTDRYFVLIGTTLSSRENLSFRNTILTQSKCDGKPTIHYGFIKRAKSIIRSPL